MYQEDIRLAIDVGSTKVCSVVVRHDNLGQPELLALNVMPCEAMTRGDLVDQTLASEVIRESVGEASQQCDLNFARGYVAIGGKHVRSFNAWGRASQLNFASGVTEQDVSNAVRNAAASSVENSDHLLYATPVRYRVDGETEFNTPPVGMHPDVLEVQAQLIVAGLDHYQAIYGAVEAADIEAIHGGSAIVAESEQMLTEYERDAGAVLVDIGGSDMEIAVYHQNRTVAVSSLPVGGFHFTNDIAISYDIPHENAEAVKLSAGTVTMSPTGQDVEIDPNALTGNERVVDVERSLSKISVSQLLRERMTDMARLLKHRINQAEALRGQEFFTLIFTGGGAKLDGFASAVKIAMGIRGNVEVRKPSGTKSLPESVSDPTMSAAMSVVLRALSLIEHDNHVVRKRKILSVQPVSIGGASKEKPRRRWRSFFRR